MLTFGVPKELCINNNGPLDRVSGGSPWALASGDDASYALPLISTETLRLSQWMEKSQLAMKLSIVACVMKASLDIMFLCTELDLYDLFSTSIY